MSIFQGCPIRGAPLYVYAMDDEMLFFENPAVKADRDVNRRTLRFNFNLKPLQSVLATQLVFLVPTTTFGSATSMYKVEQNEKPMQALDSKLTPSTIPHKQWLEFSIHYATDDTTRDLSFSVEVAEQNRTLLPSDRELDPLLDVITPLLAVYSHDPASIGQLAEEAPVPDLESEGVRKRKRHAASHWPTLEDIENEQCQRHQIFLTYEQIGWPSTNVISPPGGLDFSYCYGLCNAPFSEETEYTRHAQLLEASKNYYRKNNLPPPVFPSPCCVPMALTNFSMITETADGRIAGKVFQDVARCGCV